MYMLQRLKNFIVIICCCVFWHGILFISSTTPVPWEYIRLIVDCQANLPNIQETHNEQDFAGVGELFGNTIDEEFSVAVYDVLFGEPHGDSSGSPVHHSDNDRQTMGLGAGPGGCDLTANELLEDEDLSNQSLLQQPLAVGFYVSSAPTGPLPAWFWSSCPQRENLCPVCFRVSWMF